MPDPFDKTKAASQGVLQSTTSQTGSSDLRASKNAYQAGQIGFSQPQVGLISGATGSSTIGTARKATVTPQTPGKQVPGTTTAPIRQSTGSSRTAGSNRGEGTSNSPSSSTDSSVDASDVGTAIGTAAGFATGLIGLGLVGTAIGAAVDAHTGTKARRGLGEIDTADAVFGALSLGFFGKKAAEQHADLNKEQNQKEAEESKNFAKQKQSLRDAKSVLDGRDGLGKGTLSRDDPRGPMRDRDPRSKDGSGSGAGQGPSGGVGGSAANGPGGAGSPGGGPNGSGFR